MHAEFCFNGTVVDARLMWCAGHAARFNCKMSHSDRQAETDIELSRIACGGAGGGAMEGSACMVDGPWNRG